MGINLSQRMCLIVTTEKNIKILEKDQLDALKEIDMEFKGIVKDEFPGQDFSTVLMKNDSSLGSMYRLARKHQNEEYNRGIEDLREIQYRLEGSI